MLNQTSRAQRQRPTPTALVLAPGLNPFAFLYALVREQILLVSTGLCLLALGGQAFETLTTVALRNLVNSISVYASATGPAQAQLVVAATLYIAYAAVSAVLISVFLRLDINARTRLVSNIETSLFAYSLGHAPSYFEQRLPGQIAQQIRSASEGASALFNIFTFYGMRFLAMLISAALVFSGSIPILNLVTAIWTAAFLAGSYYITKKCTELSHDVAEKSGHLIGRLVDSLRNIEVVRSFGRHVFENAYVSRFIGAERDSHAVLRRQFFALFVFQITGKIVLNIVVVGLALSALLEGRADVGSMVMLITLANLIAALVQEISSRMYEIFDNYGAVSRALGYLLVPHEIQDAPNAAELSPKANSIRFQNVTFQYPSGGFAIDRMSFLVKPQERIGIVGVSGSGKSTILRLIKREHDPLQGRILIGDQDIAECTLSSLVGAIAEVPQRARLFNRSIRENVAYARPDASEPEILRAVGAARCLDFVAARTEGLAAEVGDDGARLSGGERQRILIARAFLRNAPILLLDEPTTALDAESERLIQQSLALLMEGKTVIVIAHRLGTLSQMDRILVIMGGCLVEEGTHADLLKSGQHYRRLWELQDRPDSLEPKA
jgi:ATP-binding cassette subfamily B protein